MVSSHSVVARDSGRHAFGRSACSTKLAYSRCRSSSARAVRPALEASARHSACQQSPLKASAPCSQGACHAGETASFGRAGLAVQASVSEHFTRRPVSKHLRPQSSMPVQFRTSPSASAAQHVCRSLGAQGRRTSVPVSSSKQERIGSQQTPNHSFKRTCLRQSA